MIRLLAAIILSCGLLTGCAQTTPSASSGAVSDEDRAIVSMVYARIAQDPVTARLNLGVESVDGIVTVNGRIDNATTKMRAIGIVRGISGVRGVIDKTVQF